MKAKLKLTFRESEALRNSILIMHEVNREEDFRNVYLAIVWMNTLRVAEQLGKGMMGIESAKPKAYALKPEHALALASVLARCNYASFAPYMVNVVERVRQALPQIEKRQMQ